MVYHDVTERSSVVSAVLGVVALDVLAMVVMRIVHPEAASLVLDAVETALTTLVDGAMNVYLVVTAVVLIVEAWVLGWSRSSIRGLLSSDRSARIDLVCGLLAAFGLLEVLVIGAGLGLFRAFAPLLQDPLHSIGILGVGAGMPVWLHVVAYFVLIDFLYYWFHRWCHRSPRLWRLHRFHHEATHFLILTGDRVHPVEIAIVQWIMVIPVLLLGTPLVVPAAVWVVRQVIDQVQHSMLPWTYGRLGDWLVVSPVGHRIHHSPLAVHRGRNLGDILSIWDRLFGTWYKGDVLNERVGLVSPATQMERAEQDEGEVFCRVGQFMTRPPQR
jgi:sterol desaturase/sphingolipid hydroxylase (fatty acid hydroxylase superfamily)